MWPLQKLEPDKPRMVRPGGLYHCCRAAVREGRLLDAPPPSMLDDKTADIGICPHCRGRLRFRDGAWEWEKASPFAIQTAVNA